MRRLSLCTSALIFLLAWLASTVVGPGGDHRFALELPASYLSVGQQFQPRLVSLASSTAVPSDDISIELRDGGGHPLSRSTATLEGMAAVSSVPWSLPAAGSYQLRATGQQGSSQTIALHALPEPGPNFGGVMGITAFGLSDGASAYLRQHGFAVTPLAQDDEGGPGIHIVVGDPRLPGEDPGNLETSYRSFWRMVGAGASALVLMPPPPGVAVFWPAIAPLSPAPAAGQANDNCTGDAFASPFSDGLPSEVPIRDLLRPVLVFNLQQPHLDAYHWDGRLLFKPSGQAGYAGCHALFSFRYGQGWVTMSTLPLLQHFQDVRARIVLLNLVKADARRKQRRVPASPGLQWITEQRLKQMTTQPPPAAASLALFYRPPQGPIEPAPQLVPLPGAACWSAPAGAAAGSTVTLDSTTPLTAQTLVLDFGADRARWPTAFALLASTNRRDWLPLPAAQPSAQGQVSVLLPPSSPQWRQFQLRIEQAPPRWSLCVMTAR